ncbi:MAG: STAS domain-containing protein [Pirellulales bacterium]
MEVVVTRRDKVVIVEPSGRIDSTTSRDLGARLLDLIKADTARVVVDFSKVIYISSAGFRVLLIAAQNSTERDCALALCGLSPEIRRLFEIGAFLDDFQIFASRDEGVAGSA